MFAPPLAHLGHWYVSLPVFMGPVLLLVLALKVRTWREAHGEPDHSGKRSTVALTHDRSHRRATITLSGPLDHPAMLYLEVELGKVAPDASEIVLDLHGVTAADEQAAWGLCDALGRARTAGRVSAIIAPDPALRVLRSVCATEGIALLDRVPGEG
jgi:ABC-type transporter Mla MlaB component